MYTVIYVAVIYGTINCGTKSFTGLFTVCDLKCLSGKTHSKECHILAAAIEKVM